MIIKEQNSFTKSDKLSIHIEICWRKVQHEDLFSKLSLHIINHFVTDQVAFAGHCTCSPDGVSH